MSGPAVNPNNETDFFARLSYLEAACFPQANNTLPPAFQGSVQNAITLYTGATDALAYPGTAMLAHSGAVDQATLATPVAGTDDGKVIRIFNGNGYANTVTTASTCIVDGTGANKHIITFAADQGGCITLEAYNGTWLVRGTPLNAGLT